MYSCCMGYDATLLRQVAIYTPAASFIGGFPSIEEPSTDDPQKQRPRLLVCPLTPITHTITQSSIKKKPCDVFFFCALVADGNGRVG
jgi:hypothetical protein